MKSFAINTLKVAKKANSILYRTTGLADSTEEFVNFSGEAANEMIKEKLSQSEPLMVARFGAVELECLANYHSIKNHRNRYLDYIKGNVHHFWWDKNTLSLMSNNAGFYPSNPFMLERFSELMMEDMKAVDILGSWMKKEGFFKERLASAIKIPLSDLEPYRFADPWSSALEGKKVLVIHPFEESINLQYQKRSSLFTNKNILPEFELKTIKAVQSIANNKAEHKDWFEALDFMKEKISITDFDIAIIGCGAYGFPLAAHVKRMGKKAIHLGGATQILFGITGKRWETEEKYEFVRNLMNQHWIRPLSSETPTGIKNVEGGCYW